MSVDVSDRAKLAVRETVTYMAAHDDQAPPTKRTAGQLHLVHVFASFGLGGVPIRIATILNHLGSRYRHTIIATDGCFDSQTRIDPSLGVSFKTVKSSRYGLLSNFRQARRTLRSLRPDLLLTYNWGAVEWGLANALFPFCRHIHFESGFGIEESDCQLRRRVLFRRLALRRADHLVVPSQTLVEIASKIWRIPNKKLLYIPNGVDCRRFAAPPKPNVLPGFKRKPDELVIGTVAPLRPEKNLGRLIRAFAALEDKSFARLVIVGDGSERRGLEELARELGVEEQTHFSGSVEGVEHVLGHFDIFALSSDTEQMPNSVLQAMAAGLPVVATDVGDVAHILSPENQRFVVTRDNATQFSDALIELLADKFLRNKVGYCNRTHVRAHYDLNQMVQAYKQIFDA